MCIRDSIKATSPYLHSGAPSTSSNGCPRYNGSFAILSLAETLGKCDFARTYEVRAWIAPHTERNEAPREELHIMCVHTEIARIYFADVQWIMVATSGWSGRTDILDALRSHVLDHVKERTPTGTQAADAEGRGLPRGRRQIDGSR